MINQAKLDKVLAAYRHYFHLKREDQNHSHWEDEKYKWIAVKHFQDHWDIDAPDFGAMFTEATSKHVNLLASQNYYPLGMIQEFIKADSNSVREMFRNLFHEEYSVVDRVNNFINEAERLRTTYGNDQWNSHFQNVNSISTYLWMKYPDKYYIYKYSECKKAAEVLDSDFKVKKGAKAEILLDFNRFYGEIASHIAMDPVTTEMLRAALTPDCYPDPFYHTLTIDVGFFISRYYTEDMNFENYVPAHEPEIKYWPSPEEDTIKITQAEWKQYIKEVEIPEHQGCMKTLKGMMDLGGEASPKKLSVVYGGSPYKYNADIINIGRRAKGYFNLPPVMYDDKQNFTSFICKGRGIVENGKSYYSFRLRDELQAALKEIDLSGIDPYEDPKPKKDDEVNYWWLNANPKIWSFQDIAVGKQQSYTLYNENGNKRRIFQNFLDAKAGDFVIGYESTPVKKIVALAKISKEQNGKEICFEKMEGLANPIDYQMLKDIPELEDMEFFTQPQGSLFRLTKEEYDIIMDIIREENPAMPEGINKEKYTKDDFLKDVYMDESQYQALVSLLRNKQNLILQGAPGVGKTFAARRLAYAMMGEKDDSRIEFVQFHQNYSYEDFMMGYKPTENGFELKYGVFYRFCMLAANHPDKDYFFIIDEINRGNMSKIFGELLMMIEKDYRNKKMTLAYNGVSFSVPKRLYIIGMMNTADRSLAMIDYALRRRFSFYTMSPAFDKEGFKNYQAELKNKKLDRLVDEVKSLNKTIANDQSLGSGFCIGHSYFCGHHVGEDDQWLYEIVNYDIIPMLNEYWFDDADNVKKWTDLLNGAIHG